VLDKQRLDDLPTSLAAVLRREGLVDLQAIARDGRQSMHRRETVERELAGARRQIEPVLEGAAMQELVERMEQPDKQALYKKRSAVAERPHMRWKGNWKWRRFPVRGALKAGTEALWLAVATTPRLGLA
jgi:hypothetical protein